MQQPAIQEHRLEYLDSSRGIAAMMVMFYHFAITGYRDARHVNLLFTLINGTEAVSFFFVLSGFVLAYRYLVAGKPLDIRAFYINRIFRIWPAFFTIVLVCALYANRQDLSLQALSGLFFHSKQQFWQEALLLRGTPKFYPPGWTLGIELAISFFMPLFIILARNNVKWVYWLIIAVLLEGNTRMSVFHMHFALGLLLCCYYPFIRSEAFKETKWYKNRLWILPLAYLLWCIRHIYTAYPFGQTFDDITDYLQLGFYFMSGLASFVFIAAIIHSIKVQRFLHLQPLRFLGKISYGLYLVHSFCLSLIFDNVKDTSGSYLSVFSIRLLIFIPLTILLATLIYYFIELPFIKLGKRLTARLRPSFLGIVQ